MSAGSHRGAFHPAKRELLIRKSTHDVRLNDVVRHVRISLNETIAAGGSTLRDFPQPMAAMAPISSVCGL
jgi:hypothetical protein